MGPLAAWANPNLHFFTPHFLFSFNTPCFYFLPPFFSFLITFLLDFFSSLLFCCEVGGFKIILVFYASFCFLFLRVLLPGGRWRERTSVLGTRGGGRPPPGLSGLAAFPTQRRSPRFFRTVSTPHPGECQELPKMSPSSSFFSSSSSLGCGRKV